MRKLLLTLLLFSTVLTLSSCVSKPIVFHPVDGQDITIQDNGWICMSPAYRETVAKVKLEAKGL